jgi:hypothetical protein
VEAVVIDREREVVATSKAIVGTSESGEEAYK